MSPVDAALLTKVLAAAGVLFVIAFVGNSLSFSNRFVNALLTAIIFAVAYGALFMVIDRTTLPAELKNMSQDTMIRMIGMSAVLVFLIDLVANMLSFSNRFVSALVTAVVFAVLFYAVVHFTGGMPMPTKPA